MKRYCFVVPGYQDKSNDIWYPYLKANLERHGITTKILKMPSSARPSIKSWVSIIKRMVGKPSKNIILVSESLGCLAIIHYLATLKKGERIGKAIFVAGFIKIKPLGKWEGRWLEAPVPWKSIKSKARFVYFLSKDDPFVPMSNIAIFKKRLVARVILEKDQGHYSRREGTKEVPSVLREVLS